MRIISGTLGGRRFDPPAKNWPTRPTTDQSKEGLFNILNNLIDFEEVKMLDLFGGTGNHCYEFASRGCKDATYVDKHGPCVAFVKKTVEQFGIEEQVRIVKQDVFKFIGMNNEKYDYIFAGPPYPLPTIPLIPDLIFENELLADEGTFVMEHNPDHDFESHKNCFDVRKYGKTFFAFFQNV